MRPPGPSACVSILAFSLNLDDEAESSPQLELELPSPEPGPEDLLQSKQEATRVQGFVHGLDMVDRDVVHRIYWEDQHQAAVARALNLSEAAISKRHSKVLTLGRGGLADLNITD